MAAEYVGNDEPRWHASLAVVAALLLYVTLPGRLTLPGAPIWVAPLIVMSVLVPLSIIAPKRHKETKRLRFWGILLIGIVNFFNITSVFLLIYGFFHPPKVAVPTPASALLLHGLQIWLTNILVFSLWFWELDGGGPDTRAHAPSCIAVKNADFLFPQMQQLAMGGGDTPCIDKNWRPMFFDYLYVAFTNSTAFSPTDTMPLTRWAKGLMSIEAMISLITIAVVLARAVSLIQ